MTFEELNKVPLNELIKRGRKWSLRVPHDPNNDPDLVFSEIIKRAEYWQKRCELAENHIETSPCDSDVTFEHLRSYSEWQDFINPLTPSVFYGKR